MGRWPRPKRAPRRPPTPAVALCALATVFALQPSARAADPNALWTIVHGLCLADEQALHTPAPCTQVDLAAGYAVLKDIRGRSQYLLIPTARVPGIESPLLLRPNSPNYFEDAWRARQYSEKSLGRDLPRDAVGLAINSVYGRSQNQLHIHIDCVRQDVRAVLSRVKDRIARRWSRLSVPLVGHHYQAMRVDGAELTRDPFQLLAAGDPTARKNMGRETLAVVGEVFSNGAPGFILLSDRATVLPIDRASGEDLLDHACRLAD